MPAEISGVHLVGSAPVERPEEIFELACKKLGPHLNRIGDGEVGERDTWIRFQNDRLAACPQLVKAEPDPELVRSLPTDYSIPSVWQLTDPDVRPESIELPKLGYADAALFSYGVFHDLKTKGVIPDHIRFMVGLPSPLSVVTIYVHANSRAKVHEAYSNRLMEELKQILEEIPNQDLSIQWEVVFEIMMLEGHPLWRYHGGDLSAGITAQFTEMLSAVPEPTEMGLHLCYGDAGHRHFLEPRDAGILTNLANLASSVAPRLLNYIHLPVPKARDDLAYFKPLKNLRLDANTVLYLGLIHRTGGDEGTLRRIATASKIVDRFGIATECGFGRRAPENLGALLDQHQRLASDSK